MSVSSEPHPVFRRIRGGNAFEETVERLLQAVKLGQVRPGERLPTERELSQRFGVSRVTLREAIRALAQAGYLESRRGRSGGTFVLPSVTWQPAEPDSRPDTGDLVPELEDALVLRRLLEVGAVGEAATRKHPAGDVRELRLLLIEEREVAVADYRPVDSRLHLALARMSGAPSVAAAVADVRMRVNTLLDAIPLLPRNITHSCEQHAAIVRAVIDGQPDAAKAAMGEHLDATAALLRGFLGP